MDSQPIPAATLIVMRDRAAAPELLMVERAKAMAFAGGMLVFPGGRVDAGDVALAATLGGEAEDMAARIAAIRETLEEAGIAVGLDVDDPAAVRAALHSGETIGEAAGGGVRTDDLVPFARWLPHGLQHRIFDTRFYLARAPKGAALAVDGSENVRAFWASAREVLAMVDRGEAGVIYPTRRNLERLALFGSYDDAVADALAHEVRAVTPWIEARDGADHLCIPDDLGYPVTSEPLATAQRA
jgi:8-oxo-dGTP pyrophosphatase MutT (NUDIX family)